MALEQGRIIGYDIKRMTFDFTMIGKAATIINCTISSAAMDQLSGSKRTMPSEREAQFLRLLIRIFHHHLR